VFRRQKRNKGQTLLEYSILVVIVIGALVGVSNYFKRGLQGRWKLAVDDLGDQYDPRVTNSSVRYVIMSNTETRISAYNADGGFWTLKTDYANTIETKRGSIRVGGY